MTELVLNEKGVKCRDFPVTRKVLDKQFSNFACFLISSKGYLFLVVLAVFLCFVGIPASTL